MPAALVFRGGADRFSLFPIQFPALWRKYKEHEASFWTAEEIDLAHDRPDDLTPDERRFVESVLGFFSWGDGMVQENLMERFMADVQLAEARTFYAFQGAMEGIHAETYGLLIEHYVPAERRPTVFRSLQDMPAMRAKGAWMRAWLDSERPFAERLIAFAIVEGVFFCGAFASIFWLKKRGLRVPGLTFSNELIARDESLHADFACLLYGMLPAPDATLTRDELDALARRVEPPPRERARAGARLDAPFVEAFPDPEERARVEGAVRASTRATDARAHEIVREAVEVESAFVARALPVRLIGMNDAHMVEYARFVADRLLGALGHPPLFGAVNPFDWMELISLQGKTNFFERRVSEYQKANVCHTEGRHFSVDDEF